MKTLLILLLSLMGLAQEQTPPVSVNISESFLRECLDIKNHVYSRLGSEETIECAEGYHHYNAEAYKANYKEKYYTKVRIAGFNILHPEQDKTINKDLKLIAKMINKNWDLVTAIEMQYTLGRDKENNEKVRKKLHDLKEEKNKLHPDDARNAELAAEMAKYEALYRKPKFLKLLDLLNEEDRRNGKAGSWALIISPNGEGTTSSALENVGFYYRSERVKPIVNEFCRDQHPTAIAVQPQFACLPVFTGSDNIFSKRPFMASFKSRDFDFTMLGTHLLYRRHKVVEREENVLKRFREDNIAFYPTGLKSKKRPEFEAETNAKYGKEFIYRSAKGDHVARYGELYVTLKFMEQLKEKYAEKDYIYTGDYNLTQYDVLLRFTENDKHLFNINIEANPDKSGWDMLIHDKTSVAKKYRSAKGKLTHGLSYNYDHFFVNRNVTTECSKYKDGNYDASVYNFVDLEQTSDIKKYIMRGRKRTTVKSLSTKYKNEFVKKFQGVQTLKSGKIVEEFSESDINKFKKNFEKKVLKSQRYKSTYYQVFTEVISDHMPVSMTCKNNGGDDD